MKIAIIFATKHGCTEKCSQTLAKELQGNTELINLDTLKDINLVNYDTIILGGSIHAGMINKVLKKFINKNLNQLLEKKVGLFLCCMEEGEKAQEQFNNAFPEQIRSKSKANGFFGGAFDFEKMNFIEKAIIKKIANIDNSLSKINDQNIKKFAEEIVK
ncbi:MAG: flavodoxin domain-containing protein [Bacteroidales bacterium]